MTESTNQTPFTLTHDMGRYVIELEGFHDCGDWVTSCHVSHGKDWGASLALLQDQGSLNHNNGYDEKKVPDTVIDRITDWAADNGY